MKKRNKLLPFLLAAVTLPAQVQKDRFVLNGHISETFNGKKIMLFAFDNDSILRVDTTTVQNKTFVFRGPESIRDIGIVTTGNYPEKVASQLVFLDRGTIRVDMDAHTAEGTRLNDLYRGYADSMAMFKSELKTLYNPDSNSVNGMRIVKPGTPYHEKMVEMGRFQVEFKKRNIGNAAGQYLFEKELGRYFSESIAYPGASDSAFFIVYNAADSVFKQKRWVQDYIQKLHKQALLTEQQENILGKQYTDFVFTDSLGHEKRLSEYVGKSRFTMLEFWASWCGPCIASFPHLQAEYEKYGRDEFEIIGISIDSGPVSWKRALTKVKVPWPQLLASDRFHDTLKTTYAFKGIPYSVLIDKDGVILRAGDSRVVLSMLKAIMKKDRIAKTAPAYKKNPKLIMQKGITKESARPFSWKSAEQKKQGLP